MIQSVEVTSKTDHAIIELSNPEGFLITDITGIDSPIGSVNMNENAITDGAVFNGARANGRNIVISLRFIEGFFGTIEELRHRCYKLFPVKGSVELVFTTDTRVIKSTGYVETNSTHIFEENEGAQISILCEDAYFSDEESTDAVFNDSEALFEPPFENYVANGVNFVKRPYEQTQNYNSSLNFVKYPFSTASGTTVAGLQYTWSDSVATPTINVSGTFDGGFPAYTIYDPTKRNGIMQGLGAGKASITMPCPFVLQYGDSSGVKGTLVNEVAGTYYFEITKEMLMYNLGLTSLVNVPQGQTFAITIQPKIYKYGTYTGGIFYSVNSDGSITANGTATALSGFNIRSRMNRNDWLQKMGAGTFTLSGCPSGGSNNSYWFRLSYGNSAGGYTLATDYGNGATFTIYKNFVRQPYYCASGYEHNGITYTINADGSITANGTATSNSQFNLSTRDLGYGTFAEKNKTYILSGSPSGSSANTYQMAISYATTGGQNYSYHDYGSGVSFTVRDDYKETSVLLMVYINSGQTVNNLTFKPMLEEGSVAHPYMPNLDYYNAQVQCVVRQGVTVNNLTFRPMISKNDSLIRDNAVKMPYVSPNHHVMNNGVFDVNPDGSVTVSTPDGETTNTASFYMYHRSSSNDLFRRLGVGTFRLSGAPDSDATALVLSYGSSSAFIDNLIIDTGNGATLTIYENFVKQPYSSGNGLSLNGITWTVNADGSIKANGTASADATFQLLSRIAYNDTLARMGKGTFTLSGCPSGGASSKYYITIGHGTPSAFIATLATDTGNGATFSINSDLSNNNLYINLTIKSGQTVNNLTFKPMLERGSVAHEYMPDLTYYNGYLNYRLNRDIRLNDSLTCYPQITQGETDTPYMYTTTKYDESLQAYVPKLPDTRTIEISNYAKEHYKVINYDGDVAAGFIVEISITGNNVKNLTVANSTTHTMMRIDDDELPTEIIVGEGLKKGDFIRIDTRMRHKSIILIRDAVEYNILSALTTNSTWLKLENGENMIRFVASQGKNDVKMKLIYNNLYEGV